MEKIVWVLGAGFSKPLGGPLLTDLLTPQSTNKLLACYPGKEWIKSTPAYRVRELYANNRYVSEASPGARLWSDAEEFLTYLDTAGAGSFQHRRGIDLLLGDLKGELGSTPYLSLAAMARRLIAAECSAFLAGTKIDSELWGPYVRWGRSLSPERNIVLTFNYDRVPERLAAESEARLQIMLPGEAAKPDRVPVYKLHGSVDWIANGDRVSVAQGSNSEGHFHTCDDYELVLATPGPTKVSVVKQLAALWKAAMDELRNAAAIVFVGYRFPPSDSEARFQILGAVAGNQQATLCVHVVLGPNKTNETSNRMRWLVVNATRRGDRAEVNPEAPVAVRRRERTLTYVQPPAWAEDFLDSTVEGHIIQAWRFPPL